MGVQTIRALGKWPLPRLHQFGRFLGTLGYRVAPVRSKVGKVNLSLCFPDQSEQARRNLLFRHYQALGIGIMELAAAWYAPIENLRPAVRYKGLEVLQKLRGEGRGALLFTGHFTSLEIIGRLVIDQFPIACFYRAPNQPVFAREMRRIRDQGMVKVLEINEMNEMVRSLRGGDFIWYTPDQGRAIKQSELSPFFGEPAVTNAITGRIARMGKAAVIPFFGYRTVNGTYEIEFFPEEPAFLSAGPQWVADRTNFWVEQFVRVAPEQYFWLHRRFKRRGHGLPKVYDKA